MRHPALKTVLQSIQLAKYPKTSGVMLKWQKCEHLITVFDETQLAQGKETQVR